TARAATNSLRGTECMGHSSYLACVREANQPLAVLRVSFRLALIGTYPNLSTAEGLLTAMRPRRRFGPNTPRICGKGTGFPRLTCIDLPHDSLRLSFERCPVSDRLSGPPLFELTQNLRAPEVSRYECKTLGAVQD